MLNIMTITKYAQSCFLVRYRGLAVLIDPGMYCYKGGFQPSEWPKVDALLLTHVHRDHMLPEAVQAVDRKSRSVVLANEEVARMLSEHNVHAKVLKPKEIKTIKGVPITGVWQLHGELPNRSPKPDVIGFLIDHALYHPGDTVATDSPPYADVVAVPMCGQVTMNPEEAAAWVKKINPQLAIPMHYHNSKFITDPELFVRAMTGSGISVKVLQNGESIEIE